MSVLPPKLVAEGVVEQQRHPRCGPVIPYRRRLQPPAQQYADVKASRQKSLWRPLALGRATGEPRGKHGVVKFAADPCCPLLVVCNTQARDGICVVVAPPPVD